MDVLLAPMKKKVVPTILEQDEGVEPAQDLPSKKPRRRRSLIKPNLTDGNGDHKIEDIINIFKTLNARTENIFAVAAISANQEEYDKSSPILSLHTRRHSRDEHRVQRSRSPRVSRYSDSASTSRMIQGIEEKYRDADHRCGVCSHNNAVVEHDSRGSCENTPRHSSSMHQVRPGTRRKRGH